VPVITEQTPLTYRDALPEKVDVVVVGAGIAGIMTAWFLQKAGKSVFICEKGRVAGEQSCRNWGFVRQAGRDPAELPMMMDGMRIWEDLQAEIGDEVGFRRPGSLFTSAWPDVLDSYEAWVEQVALPHGLPSRMVTPAEITDLMKMRHTSFKGGLYTPADGVAEPLTAVPSVAARLHKAAGVFIRENCAARVLDVQAGRVTGVHTEDGTVKAEQVLVAAGLWAGRFLANHGLRLPQLLINTTVARTEAVAEPVPLAFGYTDACFRARVDGGYTLTAGEMMEHELCADSFTYGWAFLPVLKKYWRNVSVLPGLNAGLRDRLWPARRWTADDVTPFEQTRVLNPSLSKRQFKKIRRDISRHLPDLGSLAITAAWTGSADMTPDMLPVLSAAESLPGLHVAAGFSGHGFGLGPGAGKAMAGQLLGQPPQFDLSSFNLNRFNS
jgi:glycine/D-amino acid oxidase-like deaminating enzyme